MPAGDSYNASTYKGAKFQMYIYDTNRFFHRTTSVSFINQSICSVHEAKVCTKQIAQNYQPVKANLYQNKTYKLCMKAFSLQNIRRYDIQLR